MNNTKLKQLERKCDEAMKRVSIRLTVDMETNLKDILANCKYTRTEEQIEDYQKRLIREAKQG